MPILFTGKQCAFRFLGFYSRKANGVSPDFDFNTTSADLLASNCTSCAVKQDKSAYWTPPIYFQHTNGTTEIVPQIGGMLA